MSASPEEGPTGGSIEHVSLRGATFTQVTLDDVTVVGVDVTGAEVRGSAFSKVRMRGVELIDVEINGELEHVVVNGVDVAPLVDAELNRRMPERAKMRPENAEGFREAWAILVGRNVDGEWSFIQTLRHLNFASAAWVERMILGNGSPWHPLDLPWDEAPGWDGIPWDREARPSLDEVLAVRSERQGTVQQVMASLTDEQLASEVSRTEPGWPRREHFALKECLLIVVNEEWEHRLYAERDLTALEKGD